MSSSYKKFKNKKHPELFISLSPNDHVMNQIREEFEKITGHDNIYEDRDLWDKLYRNGCVTTRHENISFEEAEVIAEPIRIDNPNQNINVTDKKGSFIGHVTWKDQMAFFFEYPTYTQRGLALARLRQAEAVEQGVIASWE
jgi:hypothetical protein